MPTSRHRSSSTNGLAATGPQSGSNFKKNFGNQFFRLHYDQKNTLNPTVKSVFKSVHKHRRYLHFCDRHVCSIQYAVTQRLQLRAWPILCTGLCPAQLFLVLSYSSDHFPRNKFIQGDPVPSQLLQVTVIILWHRRNLFLDYIKQANKMKLTVVYQLVPNRQAPCGKRSIELHPVPGPWGSERNLPLPTKPTHTSTHGLPFIHLTSVKCARFCTCKSISTTNLHTAFSVARRLINSMNDDCIQSYFNAKLERNGSGI